MRRLLSILLLALFGLPLLTPLLALAGAVPGNASDAADASLPACCRRNGAHHCAMSLAGRSRYAALASRQWSSPPQRCPFRCTALAPAQATPFRPAAPVAGLFSPRLAHPTGIPQTQSRLRIALERSRHKRGPPALLLS